jgi:hypothetical protein
MRLPRPRSAESDAALAERIAELRVDASTLANVRTREDVVEDIKRRLASARGHWGRKAAVDAMIAGSQTSIDADEALGVYLGLRRPDAVDVLLEDDHADRPTRAQRDGELQQVRAEIADAEAEAEQSQRARARRRDELTAELGELQETPAA